MQAESCRYLGGPGCSVSVVGTSESPHWAAGKRRLLPRPGRRAAHSGFACDVALLRVGTIPSLGENVTRGEDPAPARASTDDWADRPLGVCGDLPVGDAKSEAFCFRNESNVMSICLADPPLGVFGDLPVGDAKREACCLRKESRVMSTANREQLG